MTDKVPQQQGRPWGWFVVSIIVFGILMGARTEFHSAWARAAVAGCAFVVLFLPLSRFMRAKR